jgi:hypothetical protein
MHFLEALAAVDGTDPPVLLKLYARRSKRGTMIFGLTPGYTLPEGINDAEIVLAAADIRYHTDRTAAFRGHTFWDIMEDGPKIILNAKRLVEDNAGTPRREEAADAAINPEIT